MRMKIFPGVPQWGDFCSATKGNVHLNVLFSMPIFVFSLIGISKCIRFFSHSVFKTEITLKLDSSSPSIVSIFSQNKTYCSSA